MGRHGAKLPSDYRSHVIAAWLICLIRRLE